jgi:curved DNA binding protein
MSAASDSGSESDTEVFDCSSVDVVNKYNLAAGIVDVAMQGVITQCVAGKSIAEICAFGDAVIEGQTKDLFKTQKMEKGVAFPTCASVNEIVCHDSPLANESAELAAGDFVKIDMGCHLDGFIAVAAQTIQVAPAEAAPITGPQADVLRAAFEGSIIAASLIKAGSANAEVTAALVKVADAYGVKAMQGTLMHQMKRFVVDGNKVVLLREEPDQKVESHTFEENEVYAVDVAMSSGEGKPKESEQRTTVFKRAVDKSYRLKMKASRWVFNAVNEKFPTLPFTVRALGDDRQGRMGVVECLKHDLLHPYPVLKEEAGTAVAHFKFTVLLLRNGTKQITLHNPAIDWDNVKSEKKLDDESQALVDAHFAAIKEGEAKKAAAKAKKKAAAKAKKAKKAAAGGAAAE